MKKITEQQLIESARNLQARLKEGDGPGIVSKYLAHPVKTVGSWFGANDYRNEDRNDPNGNEGQKVTVGDAKMWGKLGWLGGNGQTGAIKNAGEWYTTPDNKLVPSENTNLVLNLERLGVKSQGRDPKTTIDPNNYNAGSPTTQAGTYDPDTGVVTSGSNQTNSSGQYVDATNSKPQTQQTQNQSSGQTQNQSNGPKEGDRKQSKSGKDIIFRNGAWEYL